MIEHINNKSKVEVVWTVSPYDYSIPKKKDIVEKISRKYNIPKESVKITPNFISLDEKGKKFSISTDIISNIQNPEFQRNLFKEYLSLNKIEDCDFDLITNIDNEINSKINYDAYEKYKRYNLKWIKWSNFLSYGPDNYFDFTKLSGLVLIQGVSPYKNQTGKTTFSIDLLHFLLFGNTTKYKTQGELFNSHLPESTTVEVEGCITIDGFDYIIKRKLTRPALSKRTNKSKVTQKVDYYKIVNNEKIELDDFVEAESNNGESVSQTNKIIKESIGTEYDFDLMLSTTMSNLNDLISLKSTERGQLFSKWIGLLPLEEKDVLAKAKFNSEIKNSLLSNSYNKETLLNEIEAFKLSISEKEKSILEKEKEIISQKEKISSQDEIRKTYLLSLEKIDPEVSKIDITTVTNRFQTTLQNGLTAKKQIEDIKSKIENIKVDYTVEEQEKIEKERDDTNFSLIKNENDIKQEEKNINDLTKSEFCPTCGRKYENVDNSALIEEKKKRVEVLKKENTEIKNKLIKINSSLDDVKSRRVAYFESNKLKVQKSALEVKKEQFGKEYLELQTKINDYKKNSEAIDKNNQLQIKIKLTEDNLKDLRAYETNINNSIISLKNEIQNSKENISTRESIIEKLEKEFNLVKNWKIYLDMIGKNGISKMVLRKTLPIINAKLSETLDGVCDFDIEVNINDKNEVALWLIKDGIYSNLASGSGLELTCGALALRSVLSNISTIPRANFFVADEILGAVANDNLEYLHQLILKISKDYDFILNVTHDETIKDWFEKTVLIKKVNNVSKIMS